MAYSHSGNRIGFQPLVNTETTQYHPLGTVVTGTDPTYGEGTFVYLKGVASTAVGSAVIYDNNAATTTLTVAGSRGPVAFALSANVASQYGWYQVEGVCVGITGTVAAGGRVYSTATPGSTDDAVVAGDKVDGAIFKTADGTPSAGRALIQAHWPCMAGNG